MSAGPKISLVVPLYNEAEVVGLLAERLDKALASLGMPAEIVLVDDGSTDGTTDALRALARRDPRYKALILSRNHGHQLALSAGLDHARGDAVVVLDADLQDPPELIPEMIRLWRAGHEVVYGQRTARHGESLPKRATAHLFYRVIRFLSGVDIPENAGDFRLMDRKVVDALKRMPEHYRFVRGMVAWVGFRQVALPFERPARAAGTTKYPWRKMLRFAFDAIFAFSVVPLRVSTMVGVLVMLASLLEIGYTLYLRFVLHTVNLGFTPIFISILFLGGLNLLTLGIMGEYIGRIYVETKGRPLYIVQEYVASEDA